MSSSLRILLKNLIGWPLTLASFFFLFKIIFRHSQTIIPSLSYLNIFHVLFGICCFTIFYFLRSAIWQKMLQKKGHDVPFKDASYLWARSELKRYIPGNIWSFLSRAVQFKEKGVSEKTTVSLLFIESELIVISSLLTSLFFFSYVIFQFGSNLFVKQIETTLVFLIAIIFALLYIFNNRIRFKFHKKTEKIAEFLLPPFSSKDIFELLVLYILAFFFFGIGSYLVAISLVFLPPTLLLEFIGFFSFSLLLGYLSFVTPMGLGVREGIIALGIMRFIPLSQATIVAVFLRVVLIFSELLFVSILFVWQNGKNRWVKRLENFIYSHKHALILSCFMAVYILYFTAISFLRYDNFYTGRFDLGNMDQTVWNTSKGRIFQLTDPNGTNIISRLAFHADFILILISPLYFIWADPKMLLFIQTAFLSLGALFVFLLAKKILKQKTISLVLAILYLLNPAIAHTNLYDFHPVTLATPFLLTMFYFLIKKKYLLYILFAFLAVLTKEEVWIIVALSGMFLSICSLKKKGKYLTFYKGKARFLLGLIIFVVSLAIFYILVWYAIPKIRGSQHFALSYYSDFGTSPTQIVKNILFSPLKTVRTVFQEDRLTYIFQLFLPLGFLSFFAPVYLIFLTPDLIASLLSNNAQLRQIIYQYSATLTPFIFIATMYGITKLVKKMPKLSYSTISYFLVFTTLISAYSYGPLPGSKTPNLDMIMKSLPEKQTVNMIISQIPTKYSIAATNNLGSHLSHRQKIFTIPVGIDKADFILFLLNDPFAQPSLKAQKQMVSNLKNNSNYDVIYDNGEFVVFEKIIKDNPVF